MDFTMCYDGNELIKKDASVSRAFNPFRRDNPKSQRRFSQIQGDSRISNKEIIEYEEYYHTPN